MTITIKKLSSKVAAAMAVTCCSGVALAAGFVNGGFENGTFDGWTRGGGTFTEDGKDRPGVDPGKSAIVSMTDGDWKTLYNLSPVFSGQKAARVNNWDDGYHYSTLSQTAYSYTEPKLFFSWAAVLEVPDVWNTHDTSATHDDVGPHFDLVVNDLTLGTVLYKEAYSVYSLPKFLSQTVPTHTGEQNSYVSEGNSFNDKWMYTDWQIAELNIAQGSLGHDIKITVQGSDCGWGGHGGYVYVDSFGSTTPVFDPGTTSPVPEPSTWFAGVTALSMLGFFGWKSRKQ